ncbi:hypothetical protein [Clostridium botulinum]|uniref:Uncharacterized protein n=2 Tax=Clostridium botulinum TaxID=1491 RepID=C1FRY3_CLOBJ|nr:hypothetical protein [Clostridium botulinum]ACO85594.1 conserved hypothetical protein [Clostridium botulinum A2 str. Kyoto]AUN07502.1 hypothetical protein RSJ14_12700 [Clostridium botulinum]MBN3364216.1 hypothetical protein [Clostridium botulinum]MBN3368390.1 hypothetical protein [Clostridium botulinum]MBN3376635.1 hypothetical protein [Clostridium botulinum]
MKIFKKVSTMVMALTMCLMIFGGDVVFAKTNWGDKFEDPVTIYRHGGGSANVMVPIDNVNDNDWYLIDNSSGSTFSFGVFLTPPPGINYDMQIVRVDENGAITRSTYVDDNGPGNLDGFGTGIEAGCKIYVRVMSHGRNDYDRNRPYELKFIKYD